jgi:hypothetical protein
MEKDTNQEFLTDAATKRRQMRAEEPSKAEISTPPI